jgi:hypothetical protein
MRMEVVMAKFEEISRNVPRVARENDETSVSIVHRPVVIQTRLIILCSGGFILLTAWFTVGLSYLPCFKYLLTY